MLMHSTDSLCKFVLEQQQMTEIAYSPEVKFSFLHH